MINDAGVGGLAEPAAIGGPAVEADKPRASHQKPQTPLTLALGAGVGRGRRVGVFTSVERYGHEGHANHAVHSRKGKGKSNEADKVDFSEDALVELLDRCHALGVHLEDVDAQVDEAIQALDTGQPGRFRKALEAIRSKMMK